MGKLHRMLKPRRSRRTDRWGKRKLLERGIWKLPDNKEWQNVQERLRKHPFLISVEIISLVFKVHSPGRFNFKMSWDLSSRHWGKQGMKMVGEIRERRAEPAVGTASNRGGWSMHHMIGSKDTRGAQGLPGNLESYVFTSKEEMQESSRRSGLSLVSWSSRQGPTIVGDRRVIGKAICVVRVGVAGAAGGQQGLSSS